MRKLMVPFDGSDNAMRALQYAMRTAKSGGTTIHLVVAHEEPDVYGEIAVYVSTAKMAELQRKQSEAVLAPAAKLLADAAIPHTTEVLVGPIPRTIAKRADELGCDGIVLGTRGMGAVGNLLMGSVATRIVHFANVPVTLVK